jgi:hypothetical protein
MPPPSRPDRSIYPRFLSRAQLLTRLSWLAVGRDLVRVSRVPVIFTISTAATRSQVWRGTEHVQEEPSWISSSGQCASAEENSNGEDCHWLV